MTKMLKNEKNLMTSSVDNSVKYGFDADGQRAFKYTLSSETLYFSKMWTLHTDAGNATEGGQTSKHIYLGETRIVTKLNSGKNPTYSEEYNRQYYYHADHLGSAHLITDKDGYEYQRLEYTPYGEIWVDKTSNTGLQYLPYKFTGKEMDEETGLYYYGARYLDAKYSRWISTDPALGEYMSGTSAGEGGIFNSVNFNLYHYGGNNALKYVDPDGRSPVWVKLGTSGFGHEAPQRVGGYYDIFDDYASSLGFDIDGTAFKTDSFSLRLWKGNYGDASELAKNAGYKLLGNVLSLYGGAGGEIGFYNPDGSSMKKSDLSALGITGTILEVINNKTGNIIGSRSEKKSFWTTLFSWFDNSHKEDISTRNTIIFKDEESASSFMNKMTEDVKKAAKSYKHNRQQNIDIQQEGKKIIINWGSAK